MRKIPEVFITTDEADAMLDEPVHVQIVDYDRRSIEKSIIGNHPIHGLVEFTHLIPTTDDFDTDQRFDLNSDGLVTAWLVEPMTVQVVRYVWRTATETP